MSRPLSTPIRITNAQALGRYRKELVENGIDDELELHDLIRDAATHLLEASGLGVSGEGDT